MSFRDRSSVPCSSSMVLPWAPATSGGTGEYCKILTAAGLVGCAIFDVGVAAEFGDSIAIVKGTPGKPLVEPEDLLDARIVGVSPKAQSLGVRLGMTGREAVETFLAVPEEQSSGGQDKP